MGKEKIREQLKIYINRIKEKFKPEKIILFGSYARGEATDYSDIDILVISKRFEKMKEDDRFEQLYVNGKDLYPDINAFGFTPQEVKKASRVNTLYEAVRTGIVIS